MSPTPVSYTHLTAQVRLDRVLGLTRENLTGVRVVRAFDKEQDEIDRFENANDPVSYTHLHRLR